MMDKIKIHSITDLITNSSTTIYTYSRGSVDAFKSVVNEMLLLCGRGKTCDDIFSIVVACQSFRYVDWKIKDTAGLSRSEEKELKKSVEAVWEDVIHSRAEKPDWFSIVENQEDPDYYVRPETYIYISAKLPEFESLGNLLKTFLYSTDHEAFRDD
jgi:hypothetical protein